MMPYLSMVPGDFGQGHIMMDSRQQDAFREYVRSEERTAFLAETGQLKCKKIRNTIMAEPTPRSSRPSSTPFQPKRKKKSYVARASPVRYVSAKNPEQNNSPALRDPSFLQPPGSGRPPQVISGSRPTSRRNDARMAGGVAPLKVGSCLAGKKCTATNGAGATVSCSHLGSLNHCRGSPGRGPVEDDADVAYDEVSRENAEDGHEGKNRSPLGSGCCDTSRGLLSSSARDYVAQLSAATSSSETDNGGSSKGALRRIRSGLEGCDGSRGRERVARRERISLLVELEALRRRLDEAEGRVRKMDSYVQLKNR